MLSGHEIASACRQFRVFAYCNNWTEPGKACAVSCSEGFAAEDAVSTPPYEIAEGKMTG